MNNIIKPSTLSAITIYSKGIANGIVNILKEYCYDDTEKTDRELDDAIRLFVLESAYRTGVVIDVNAVVDSIGAEIEEFIIKWKSTREE